ncbi:MAG: molybdenum cofactor biosynthesis protein A [Candidatus Bathyarchaeota archaeon BA1]|nr:MAG: molybdenum cofactor biosynthesis protein A [Candidatus Bathyarchaeota archaeon BA1]
MPLVKKRPSVIYWFGDNLYLNITNRCSNRCYFCFGKFKNGIEGFNLKLLKEPSSDEIIMELQKVINRKNWREIVFCGFGEPLERLDCVLEITRWIKRHARKVVRINTNGQGCLLNRNREVVKELREAGVDMVSVSLNAHDRETYNHVCRPEFGDVFESILEFIQKAKGELNLEITAVTIPEVDISKVSELATKMGVEFRVRPYITCFW